MNHHEYVDKNVLILCQHEILTLLSHSEILLELFKEFHDVQSLQLVKFLERRKRSRAHNIFELINRLLEGRHSIFISHRNNLIKDRVAFNVYGLKVIVLINSRN